ncbi:VWA domain-containing protein [Candidatus Neomarinimicrobiota bacterium]
MLVEFSAPHYLFLLILIPILLIWYLKKGRKSEGTIQISSTQLITKNFITRGRHRSNLLISLQMMVLIFVILGLARPRAVDTLEESIVDIIDIVMVLDISSSMLAEDFQPNRLEAVKKTAEQFVNGRQGDRIGLLVFAGETFIQCPLTIDIDVLKNLLKEVTVAEKEYDGTAIGMAIANATNRLRNSNAISKVIILLSDGSNNAGELDPLTAADMAKEFDIKIYTIGAGTNESVTYIPNRGYIRNEIDEETLKEISGRTDARYFRATDVKSLELIYEEIDKLERSEIEIKTYTRYKELYTWFLFPALFTGIIYQSLQRSILRRIS